MALRIKTQWIKTCERIVQCSLELFNRQGERSVSTYPIAAHREILPDKQCYYVANKRAIIAELLLSTKRCCTASRPRALVACCASKTNVTI